VVSCLLAFVPMWKSEEKRPDLVTPFLARKKAGKQRVRWSYDTLFRLDDLLTSWTDARLYAVSAGYVFAGMALILAPSF